MIHEKNLKQKSHVTVPLIFSEINIFLWSFLYSPKSKNRAIKYIFYNVRCKKIRPWIVFYSILLGIIRVSAKINDFWEKNDFGSKMHSWVLFRNFPGSPLKPPPPPPQNIRTSFPFTVWILNPILQNWFGDVVYMGWFLNHTVFVTLISPSESLIFPIGLTDLTSKTA